MESSSPAVRRRAWINSSRQWLTLEEHDSEGRQCSLPSASTVDDDVFSDGCISGKIENWLLSCGSGVSSENFGRLSFESPLKAEHFDTVLSLGVDASLLNVREIFSASGSSSLTLGLSSKQSHPALITSAPHQNLCLPMVDMGHSMASSCLSSSTSNSTVSVLDILRLRAEDPEETLFELGFGCDEPQLNIRIPSRFFTFPSQARGINFRLYLDSQLQRIQDEDPSLTLASRFRQVQVLTTMANAFYSLYSHVSRTPLQKLGPPQFNFYSSPVERMERFRSSIRSEPRSPVERLKDTVSKMCLYTGSPRGSESTSPQPSPKKRCSLPDVGAVVREKVDPGLVRNLDLGESNRNNLTADARLGAVDPKKCQETSASDAPRIGNKPCCINNTDAAVGGSDEDEIQGPLCQGELDPTGAPAATTSRICCGTERVDAPSLNTDATSQRESSRGGLARCCIALTGWEGEDISSSSLNAAGPRCASAVPATKTRGKEAQHERDVSYLTPPIRQNHGSDSSQLQQVNSFELEEVHSAGEEDFGRSETTASTSLQPKECQYNRDVVRGDSMHSDSSGYADEEISSSNQ